MNTFVMEKHTTNYNLRSHSHPITVSPPPWLPQGWTAQIKIRDGGITAGNVDRYYHDPVSNNRFRSKREVFNFLATRQKSRRQNRLIKNNEEGIAYVVREISKEEPKKVFEMEVSEPKPNNNEIHVENPNSCTSSSPQEIGTLQSNEIHVEIPKISTSSSPQQIGALQSNEIHVENPKISISSSPQQLGTLQSNEIHVEKAKISTSSFPQQIGTLQSNEIHVEKPKIRTSSSPQQINKDLNNIARKLFRDLKYRPRRVKWVLVRPGETWEPLVESNESASKYNVDMGFSFSGKDSSNSTVLEETDIQRSSNSKSSSWRNPKKEDIEEELPDLNEVALNNSLSESANMDSAEMEVGQNSIDQIEGMPFEQRVFFNNSVPEFVLYSKDELGFHGYPLEGEDCLDTETIRDHDQITCFDPKMQRKRRKTNGLVTFDLNESEASPIACPFADSWPDPCVEFAVKTLTQDLTSFDIQK